METSLENKTELSESVKKLPKIILWLLGATLFFSLICLTPVIRDLIIYCVEKFIKHRPVSNYGVAMEMLYSFFEKITFLSFVLLVCLYISKIVVDKEVSFLAFLRVIAALMVFLLHTSLFTNKSGTLFNALPMKPLKTPAWGGMDFLYSFRLSYR